MTQILDQYIFGNEESERVVKDWRILREKSFDQYVVEKVTPYIGMTQDELKTHFLAESFSRGVAPLPQSRFEEACGDLVQEIDELSVQYYVGQLVFSESEDFTPEE